VAAVGQIGATVAGHHGTLASTFAAQREQADTALRAHTGAVAAGTTAARARTAATSVGARAGLQADAAAASTATRAAVDADAGRVEAQGAAQASRALQEGPAKVGAARPATSSPDPDIAAGQQRVAEAVSTKATTELQGSAKRTADTVRSHASTMRTNVYGPVRQGSASQIDAVRDQSGAAVSDATSVATEEISQLGSQAGHVAEHAHGLVTSALAAGQATAHADLDTWAEQGASRIRTTASQLADSIGRHGTALANAVGSLRPALRAAGAAAAMSALQDAGTRVTATVGDTGQGLAEGAAGLAQAHTQSVTAVGGQAAAGLAGAAQAANQAADQAAEAFGQHAATVRSSAGGELAQAPQRAAQGLGPHTDKAVADLSGTVEQAGQAQQTWVSTAHAQGDAGTAQVASAAQRLEQEHAPAPVQRFLDSLIASMRSYLRDHLGNIAGGILSGIILSLPAILLTVALLLSGPVGWAVLAGLLVVGIGLGIYSRFTEYAADHGGQGPGWGAGIGLVVLGALDVTGLPYIVEAGYGQRAFAPAPMSSFERWERGTQGVISLALLAAGGAKKLFGGGEVHPTVPVDPRAPVPVDPRAPVPVDVDPNAPHPVEGSDPVPSTSDPAKVPITGESNAERFGCVRRLILDAPAGERAHWARTLFQRLRELSGNTWQANEASSADGGTYWTGEGRPFLFAIDPQGNVFQGESSLQTLLLTPSGRFQVVYALLRPLTGAPTPPPPVPAPVPAVTPPVGPPPQFVPSAHFPPPPHDDHATVP
jgi:hypothetical protein